MITGRCIVGNVGDSEASSHACAATVSYKDRNARTTTQFLLMSHVRGTDTNKWANTCQTLLCVGPC